MMGCRAKKSLQMHPIWQNGEKADKNIFFPRCPFDLPHHCHVILAWSDVCSRLYSLCGVEEEKDPKSCREGNATAETNPGNLSEGQRRPGSSKSSDSTDF
jgi:hypothetical protein